MEYLYLLNTEYDNEKSRVILHFSKNPLSSLDDLIIKRKVHPYLFIGAPKRIIKTLLSDFKNKVSIIEKNNKTKVIANNYETLKKCHKIIYSSINKNILLIEPERQYLINNNWSYYDAFISLGDSDVKKVSGFDLIHSAIKEYLITLSPNQPEKLIRFLTKKLILTNILKVKPNKDIKPEQILNILFENNFFKEEILLKDKSKNKFEKEEKIIKETKNIDFSNIWPHLLKDKYYNIGYETINCNCCKPNKIENNIFSNSLVEVKFLKNGFYFISKDKEWSKEYHKTMPNKDKRKDYKFKNKIKEIPIGPFYMNNIEKIPLCDAIKLLENKDIKLTNKNNNLIWHCKKKESFVSKIVKDIDRRLKCIENSINLSTYINHSKIINTKLERNPSFIQYMTEYVILNDILKEIPKFMLHPNTKFYDPLVAKTIKSIKLDTYAMVNPKDKRVIEHKENLSVYDNNIISKINKIFIKLELPVPRLITT